MRHVSTSLRLVAVAGLVLVVSFVGLAGQDTRKASPPAPGPMLEQGTITLETPDLTLTLVKSSQTVASLRAKGADQFDFTPGDLLIERSRNGFYHLGDIDLRVRVGTSGEWRGYSTAQSRTPVTPLPASASWLAASDLAATLPADVPLDITRTWLVENGHLVLRFALTNKGTRAVQIGSLGIPMVFHNVLTNRSLDQAHATCVFSDPYIGGDAGYLQVTRLTGRGPALVVVPDGRTPFEGYNPLLNPDRPTPAGSLPPLFTEGTRRGQTFEGFFDWMAHTQAYAENEWKKATPWNAPTMATLEPGESRSFGVKFLVADDVRAIERTLVANGRPVAVGIPGYVLPMDIDARLFLETTKPVRSVTVEPPGAIVISRTTPAGAAKTISVPPTSGRWQVYALKGRTWGRARVTITYADDSRQTVHYVVTKPQVDAVGDLGRFLTTRQWFVDPADPFKRSPSVMTYDRDENRIVTEDTRAWVAGLGDEGGSSWLTGAMKQLGRPEKSEIDKYQEFVDKVLWGGLQYADGPKPYGVRKSLFYYQPDQFPTGYYRNDWNWTTWTSWNKAAAETVDRSYDYPHVAALHWTMYRLARNHAGLVTNHPWEWYLTNAYQTTLAMMKYAKRYAQFGQMEGTVFVEILRDLRREGWTEQASTFEQAMKARADVWMRLAYPYGSEMAWDSTGQEEVYAWTRHFGDAGKAAVTLDAILGYMPTLPSWGYNGCARRYWDFQYAGKIRRIERQLHHYGSGLNAIPVLTEYRDHPDDLYLLRVGYGGMMGAITSIDQDGFASAAFHSFPDTLRWDPISGDYAQNFLGHALNAATYLVRDPGFGWQAFGGNVTVSGSRVTLTPLDAVRTRVYLAPTGLWLTLDAGHFDRIEFDRGSGAVRLGFAPATTFTPAARLRIEQPARPAGAGTYSVGQPVKTEREACVIPLGTATTWLALTPAKQ
jgi:hypothetical protein